MDEHKFKAIVSCLEGAERELAQQFSKHRVITAKTCLEAGFIENILNAPMLRSLINLLAPFIKNHKVKTAVKMLQEGLEEEKLKEKKKVKSDIQVLDAPQQEVKS